MVRPPCHVLPSSCSAFADPEDTLVRPQTKQDYAHHGPSFYRQLDPVQS